MTGLIANEVEFRKRITMAGAIRVQLAEESAISELQTMF